MENHTTPHHTLIIFTLFPLFFKDIKEIEDKQIPFLKMSSFSSFFITLLFLSFSSLVLSEIHSTYLHSDDRPTIPLDEFGFTNKGRLLLNVSKISLSSPQQNPLTDLPHLGFFLCTRDSWIHVIDQIVDGQIACPLDSAFVKKVLTFDSLGANKQGFHFSFNVSDANQFTLLFANCVPGVVVSMDVVSTMYNLDGKSGIRDYLSAGKTNLPLIYFIFFLIYAALTAIWVFVLYNKRLTVHMIHFFMLAVVVLKALNLVCETEDKSYIKKTGTAHGWDVLFYIFSFLKGISLFTLIVLIGTGWSFLKPYLQDREKKILIIVIPLQVIANVAQVIVDETGPFEEESYTWKQVFLLVDLVCCCAVLFPIVWSIKNLRESAKTDGKAAVNLMKLTLFRQYYIIVICYIYFTRVIVYALQTITSYRYQWTSVVAAELATLAFYVFTGYNFRPKVHNPYLALDDEEEEAALEELRMEDEFEL